MKNLLFIILIIVFSIVILISIFLFVRMIVKQIKNYLNMDKNLRDKYTMIWLICFCPLILIILDSFNIFHVVFPKYWNMTREYDMLSFLGTYAATIVSSLLLILITEKDREENTEVLRESQRPYLDVCYMKVSSKFFKNENPSITVFEHGTLEDRSVKQSEYLVLKLKNSGQTVAIIDINKTKVKIMYSNNGKELTSDFKLNTSINRLSVRSGEEVYVKICKKELYSRTKLKNDSKIIHSEIYYKDLFNKNYIDECEMKNNLLPIRDNEVIED